MIYLLDTNVLLWFLTADKRLGRSTVELVQRRPHQCRLSIVSLWEIVMKVRSGRLGLPGNIFDILAGMGLSQVELSMRHLEVLDSLSKKDLKDPFDELIMAQALTERMVLVTSDTKMLKSRLDGLAVVSSMA